MAPTVSIETVNLVRPLKVIAVMCGLFAILLQILMILSSAWLFAGFTREGLWVVCSFKDGTRQEILCDGNSSRPWIDACRAFCLLAIVTNAIAVVFMVYGLNSCNSKTKYTMYKLGIAVMFSAFLMLFLALVIFPVKFLEENSTEHGWDFGWSYGIGWGAEMFMFGSALLLFMDKGTEEIIYMEKEVDANGEASDEEPLEI